LGFIENDLEISIREEDFDASIRNPIEKVLEQVRLIVGENGQSPSVVFATGGMSQSPLLLNALQSELGQEVRVERLDSMSAVGIGLGIVANALTSRNQVSVDSMISLGLST
jgi:molecular chaperone DnaK (HSP70)